MKRMKWVLVASVLLAACGGATIEDVGAVAESAPSQTMVETTPAADTGTGTEATLGTENAGSSADPAQDPTLQASIEQPPATTTTMPEFGPDVLPTPIARLDRYRWEVEMAITDDHRQVVLISSEGSYRDGAYECEVKVTRFNRTAYLTLTETEDGRRYLDRKIGSGVRLVEDSEDTDDDEIFGANLAFCAGAEEFWQGLGVEGELLESETIVERNDRSAQRLDLTTIPAIKGFLSPLGPPGQTTYDRYTLFITTEGGWINGIEMSAKVAPKAIAELADTEEGPSGRLDVIVDILDAQADDIEVEDPDPDAST